MRVIFTVSNYVFQPPFDGVPLIDLEAIYFHLDSILHMAYRQWWASLIVKLLFHLAWKKQEIYSGNPCGHSILIFSKYNQYDLLWGFIISYPFSLKCSIALFGYSIRFTTPEQLKWYRWTWDWEGSPICDAAISILSTEIFCYFLYKNDKCDNNCLMLSTYLTFGFLYNVSIILPFLRSLSLNRYYHMF